MKWIIILALVFGSANAYMVGAYNLTFDPGFPINLSSDVINTETPDGHAVTKYTLKCDELQFRILEFNETNILFPLNTKEFLDGLGCSRVEVATRSIDNHIGEIGSTFCYGNNAYLARWWMDNHTLVEVGSVLPWDNGTLNIIKTIHIERLNETTIPD